MDNKTDYQEFLEEARERRRNAYVDAVTLMSQGKTLIDVMGRTVPGFLLRAMDVIPVYIASTDGHASKFSKSFTACSLLKATEGYAISGKCPLIYSVSGLITDDICVKRENAAESIAMDKLLFVLKKSQKCYLELIDFIRINFSKELIPEKLQESIDENNKVRDLSRELSNLIREKDVTLAEEITILNGLQFHLEMKDKIAYLNEAVDVLSGLNPRESNNVVEFRSIFPFGIPESVTEIKPDKGLNNLLSGNNVMNNNFGCDGEVFYKVDNLNDAWEKLNRSAETEADDLKIIFKNCHRYKNSGAVVIEY